MPWVFVVLNELLQYREQYLCILFHKRKLIRALEKKT
jgi:hypothetical protein